MDGWMHGRKEKRRKGGRKKKEKVLALLLLLTRKLVTFSCYPLPAPLALDPLFHSILVFHLQSKCVVPGLNLTSVSIKELTKEESGLTPE